MIKAASGQGAMTGRKLTLDELMTLLKSEKVVIKAHQSRFHVLSTITFVETSGVRFALSASKFSEDWFVLRKHVQANHCSMGEVGLLQSTWFRALTSADLRHTQRDSCTGNNSCDWCSHWQGCLAG